MVARIVIIIIGIIGFVGFTLAGLLVLVIKKKKKKPSKRQRQEDDLLDLNANPFEDEAPTSPPPPPPSPSPPDPIVFINAIFSAFESEDLTPLAQLEHEHILSEHQTILTDYQNSNLRRITRIRDLIEQTPINKEQSFDTEYLSFETDLLVEDYLVDRSNGQVLAGKEGEASQVRYFIKLARPLQLPNYTLTEIRLPL